MKRRLSLIMLLSSAMALAEPVCDVRVGDSIGIKVVEFATGNRVHSKMPLSEGTVYAIQEEMINLQDEGVCAEEIVSRKCVLKFEKAQRGNRLTLYRGQERWSSWPLNSKRQVEDFVKGLKKAGFCS